MRKFICCYLLSIHETRESVHPLNGLVVHRCARCGYVEAWWLP